MTYKLTKEEKAEILKLIGKKFLDARTEKKFKQPQVIKKVIVSQSQLSKIESGKVNPDIITLIELSLLYKKDLFALIPWVEIFKIAEKEE